MKFKIKYLNEMIILFFKKTALYLAVENENIEIIKLLSKNEKIDVNIPWIIFLFSYKIQSHAFQLHYKTY